MARQELQHRACRRDGDSGRSKGGAGRWLLRGAGERPPKCRGSVLRRRRDGSDRPGRLSDNTPAPGASLSRRGGLAYGLGPHPRRCRLGPGYTLEPAPDRPQPAPGPPHHDVGMVATDLRGALAEGTYRGQVRRLESGDDLLYYVGATASLDLDDYRRVVRWERFNFCAGASTVPTWCRTRNGTAAVLTIDGGPA